MLKVVQILVAFSVLTSALPSLKIFRGKEAKEQLTTNPISYKSDQMADNDISIAPAPFGKYIEYINGVPLELLKAPQGSFIMGNNRSPNLEEKPAHQVNVRSFFIGQFEVTRQQWNIVASTLPRINRNLPQQYLGPVRAGSSIYYSEMTPADELAWVDAVEFCDRLTSYTGKKHRLPSEAEWEYACRAGTQTEYSFGDQFDQSLANMVFVSDFLLPVGSFNYANAWGLYDMHGNVYELCQDNEHLNYVGAPTDGSVWERNGNDNAKAIRGGGYRLKAEIGRSSSRAFYTKNLVATGFGIRVVAEITPSVGTGQTATVSAANYSGATLAADSIGALFGSNLASTTQVASTFPLPVTIAGTSVVIKDSSGNEFLANLFFASPNQINFLIPAGLTLGVGSVSVVTNGNIHSTGAIVIGNINPGLFSANATGKDVAAAVALRIKSNGEQIYEPVAIFDNGLNRFIPVAIDLSQPNEEVFLVLFGTGFRNRTALNNVSATVGGQTSEVLFAGAQGELVGVDQCNIRLPHSLAGRGEVNLNLVVEGQASNVVQVRIK